MKYLRRILLVLALLYVGLCLAVYDYPQLFFYNPTDIASNLEKAQADGYPAEQVEYTSADGTKLLAWYTKPTTQKKIIIFMHGNSYNVEKFAIKMVPLMEAGYGTFMPEYRGFGAVSGKITQANLEADAIAAVRYLYSLGYKNRDIIVYGMSLGSHMAVNSAYSLQQEKKSPFSALILEVPFDNLVNVVKMVFPLPMPWNQIIRDRYENATVIAKIKSPLLIMGGSEDHTVPLPLAKNLFAQAAEPKKMIIYQGGAHSNLYDFKNYKDILGWLKTHENH